MAKVGINTFIWTTNWNNSSKTRQIFRNIKTMGFDAVQIPLLSLDSFNTKEIYQILKKLELECYISAGLKDDMDITSDNSKTRQRGIDFLKECVQVASQIGSVFLSGSFHSVFGKKSQHPVGIREWEHSARSLKEVAKEAQKHGLCIVLEPINRYESFLINTASQAKKLIKMIGESNVKIQLDTFHMNLEENDFYNTIKTVEKDLVHFHVAENHRGRFNQGMTPWDNIFKALSEIDYKGAIVIESFVPEVTEVATAACIWRKMAPSADFLAREGLEFIKKW
ncbi:sugar phosphate isomerase/epimerase [candidate division WOR-3 bacterium]|nr:sugar phosphate isomerase/epimerase [candidate division WOR-3 bacterium]